MSALPPKAKSETSLTPHADPAQQGEDHTIEISTEFAKDHCVAASAGILARPLSSIDAKDNLTRNDDSNISTPSST